MASPTIEECFVCHWLLQSFQRQILGSSSDAFVFFKTFVGITASAFICTSSRSAPKYTHYKSLFTNLVTWSFIKEVRGLMTTAVLGDHVEGVR